MKYIIVEERGLELPIVFNEIMSHTQVAGLKRVVSAGFCSFSPATNDNGEGFVKVNCWGHSLTLDVKSRGKDDAEIIQKTIDFRC